ncbi:MAG: ABC transporter substrate-binding protein [Thermomicrobiales bacterium]
MQRRNSHAAHLLMKDSLNGRISRRDVMKRAAALGVSASMAGTMLRAYGAAAQGSPAAGQEPGWSLVMPEVRTDLSGQEITVVMGSDGPSTPFEEAVVAMFAEATGIVVNRIAGAQSATDRLTQYQQFLGAEASDIDSMQIDVIWPGILATHAIDLSETLAANEVEYFERIVTNNTVNEELVGIPWFTDAGILYYRTDLLDKYGFEAPPMTWAELTEMAQTIQDGEREAAPDFQGFVWQGAAYEGLTCDALEWQVSHGGGVIVEEDLTVSVNNPQAIAAFNMARGWVGTITPEGVTNYREEDARNVWQGGNAAFMRNWPYAYSLGQAEDSVIRDLFDVTLLPMGEGEGAQHADTLGGWQMMVSRYSEAPEAATEWAKFATSREFQKAHAIERSLLPTIPELYDDPEVLAANPFFAQLKDVFLGGAVARPSSQTADLYNEVSTAYFTVINQILTGSVEAEPAVEELAGELEDIVADL